MAETKRVSELMIDLLKDCAIAFGVGILATPYLQGCNHAGALSAAVAYIGVSVFSLALSLIAIYRCSTELLRRFQHSRTIFVAICVLAFGAVLADTVGITLATDSSYHPATHIGWWDGVEGFFVNRLAFANTCPKP